MASRPSGLRQPSAIRASNSNIASSAAPASGLPAPEVAGATPAKQTPAGSSALPMSRLPSSNSIRRKITTPAGINPPGSRDSGLATDIDSYLIGDTVYVNGDPDKRGRICFIGEVGFAKGDFAGIALDLPMGNHDGVVQGKRYFQCTPNHGLFTKLSRLTRDPILDSPSTPRAPQSVVGSTVGTPDRQLSRAASIVAERTPSPSGMRTPGRSPNVNSSLSLGERVIVASATGGTKIGILRYLGATEFAVGEWAGVELLTPMGKNNGSVKGKSYFTCKEKHGLFVPASKVISSPVNKTPRRHGSRESLISVSSMASSAASRSIRRPSMRDSQCLPTCSLQAVLAEKEKHMERLIKERELDRVDLANLSREFEEKKLEVKKLQVECAGYQQQIQASTGDSDVVTRLQNALEEEHRKLEDLQYTLDEEKIMKADVQTQLDALLAKTSEETMRSSEQSKVESEERTKELETLKAQIIKLQEEAKSAGVNFQEAQLKINAFEKTIDELNQNLKTLTEQLDAGKGDRAKLIADHEAALAALKNNLSAKDETVEALKQKMNDKKRAEEELKEKCDKLHIELESTLKQKCSLEAEVIDLVNSKSNTSDLLSTKINDLNNEVQDLRAKLQSTEEDKALLRRINAEFKSRISQNEQNEALLKKQIEQASSTLSEESSSREKQFSEKLSSLEAEKQKLLNEIKSKEDEVSFLKSKLTEAEAKVADTMKTSEKYLQQIETIKSDLTGSAKQVEEHKLLLKNAEEEKAATLKEKEQKEEELNDKISELCSKNKELTEKVEQLLGQLTTSATESATLKSEIETLKTEVTKAKQSCDEKNIALKSLEEEISMLSKKSEEDGFVVDEMSLELDKLKRDKASLKEQITAYKAESSRFQEIEKGLSQEVVSLRSKLDQKNKMVLDLEKELLEKKADIESSKAQTLDANSPQAHIDFLNSIIVDLQRKNEELNVKLNVLINGGGDADANSNHVPVGGDSSSAPRPFQSLRTYCDICEKFDLHDTEDCPAQAQEEGNTHYGSTRGESRPYCETCEIFGHITGECDDQETY